MKKKIRKNDSIGKMENFLGDFGARVIKDGETIYIKLPYKKKNKIIKDESILSKIFVTLAFILGFVAGVFTQKNYDTKIKKDIPVVQNYTTPAAFNQLDEKVLDAMKDNNITVPELIAWMQITGYGG